MVNAERKITVSSRISDIFCDRHIHPHKTLETIFDAAMVALAGAAAIGIIMVSHTKANEPSETINPVGIPTANK